MCGIQNFCSKGQSEYNQQCQHTSYLYMWVCGQNFCSKNSWKRESKVQSAISAPAMYLQSATSAPAISICVGISVSICVGVRWQQGVGILNNHISFAKTLVCVRSSISIARIPVKYNRQCPHQLYLCVQQGVGILNNHISFAKTLLQKKSSFRVFCKRDKSFQDASSDQVSCAKTRLHLAFQPCSSGRCYPISKNSENASFSTIGNFWRRPVSP